MNIEKNAITMLFSNKLDIDIEFLINKQLESVSADEFIEDTAIEVFVMPSQFGGIRFYGSYGQEGETYGYFDLEFESSGKLLHDRLNIDSEEAYKCVSKYYNVEHWK